MFKRLCDAISFNAFSDFGHSRTGRIPLVATKTYTPSPLSFSLTRSFTCAHRVKTQRNGGTQTAYFVFLENIHYMCATVYGVYTYVQHGPLYVYTN